MKQLQHITELISRKKDGGTSIDCGYQVRIAEKKMTISKANGLKF